MAVTASVLEHERQRYLTAGFEACIAKPVHERAIYQCLARFLHVEYEYLEEPTDVFDPAGAELPAALWQRLRAAAKVNDVTDLEAAVKVVEQSSPQGPRLAACLTELIDQFDMGALVALLEQVKHD